jgi:hypothetical protein
LHWTLVHRAFTPRPTLYYSAVRTMSHEKIGPHELRLRELREERERKAKGPRKLIPYAGKDRTVPGTNFTIHGAKKGKKK